MPELATTLRYLKALQHLSQNTERLTRAWARQTLRDLSEPGVVVHEYLEEAMALPFDKLTPFERLLRTVAATHTPHVVVHGLRYDAESGSLVTLPV